MSSCSRASSGTRKLRENIDQATCLRSVTHLSSTKMSCIILHERHSTGRMAPEGINGCPHGCKLKSLIFNVSRFDSLPSNVLAVTFGALEWGANVVPRARPPKPNLVLHFCKGGPVEVPGDCCLESVKVVSGKALSTPRPPAGRETSTGMTIVGAYNSRLKGDTLLTPQTLWIL